MYGFQKRLRFGQLDIQLEPGQLAQVLERVIVERVVGRKAQHAAAAAQGQHMVTDGQGLRHQFQRFALGCLLGKVGKRQVQPPGQRLQNLALGREPQRGQRLADAQAAVFFLVRQRLLQLAAGDGPGFCQEVAQAGVVHSARPSVSYM